MFPGKTKPCPWLAAGALIGYVLWLYNLILCGYQTLHEQWIKCFLWMSTLILSCARRKCLECVSCTVIVSACHGNIVNIKELLSSSPILKLDGAYLFTDSKVLKQVCAPTKHIACIKRWVKWRGCVDHVALLSSRYSPKSFSWITSLGVFS